jgi:hypothetical protein
LINNASILLVWKIWSLSIFRVIACIGLISTGFTIGACGRIGFGLVPAVDKLSLFATLSLYFSVPLVFIYSFRGLPQAFLLDKLFARIWNYIFRRSGGRNGKKIIMLISLCGMAFAQYLFAYHADSIYIALAGYLLLSASAIAIAVADRGEFNFWSSLVMGCILLSSVGAGASAIHFISQYGGDVYVFTDGDGPRPQKAKLIFSTSNGVFIFLPNDRDAHFYSWQYVRRIAPHKSNQPNQELKPIPPDAVFVRRTV